MVDISSIIKGPSEATYFKQGFSSERNLHLLVAVADAVSDCEPVEDTFNEEQFNQRCREDIKELARKWSTMKDEEPYKLLAVSKFIGNIQKHLDSARLEIPTQDSDSNSIKLCKLVLLAKARQLAASNFKNCHSFLYNGYISFATKFVQFTDPTNVYFWETVAFMVDNNLELDCEIQDYYRLHSALKKLKEEKEKAVVRVLNIMAIFMANVEMKTFDDFRRNCDLDRLRAYLEDLKMVEKSVIKPLDFMVKALFFIDRAVDRKEIDFEEELSRFAEMFEDKIKAIYARLEMPTDAMLVSRFVNDQDWLQSRKCHLCLTSFEEGKGHRTQYFTFCSIRCKENAWQNRIKFESSTTLLAKFEHIFNVVTN